MHDKVISLNPGPGTEKGPMLYDLPPNTRSMIIALKWIDFLLHRVKRDRLLPLMNYYQEIGWIGEKAKSRIMKIARGTLQDVSSFNLEEDEENIIGSTEGEGILFRSMNEYRISASDHIRSLMFIIKMKGDNIEEAELESVEGELSSIMGS